MKIITSIYILFALTVFHITVCAQNNHYKPKIEKCGTMQMLEELQKKDPSLKQRMMQIEQDIQKRIKQKKAEHLNLAASVRVIPVVVHVVYNTTEQNISDAQILSQINVLNEDYRRIQGTSGYNTDTLGADTHIEFRLATKDPDGNATNGITRDSTSKTSFYYLSNEVKSAMTGGADPWDSRLYLNLWVCKLDGALGVTELPGGPAATDGVIIGYEYFGDNVGTATTDPYQLGRTTTHEVGHWLNLYHTWGDKNDCSGTDFVDDTPPCSDTNFSHTPTCDAPIQCKMQKRQIQNYMDYSDDACMNIFTKGQSDRMNAVLDRVRNSILSSPGLDNRDFTLFSTHTGYYEYNVTDSISTSADSPYSDFLISDKNNVILRAGSNITLKPGFNVADGAIFRAYIDNSILTTLKPFAPPIEEAVITEYKKQDIIIEPSKEELKVYPNPFTNKLTINYISMATNDKVSIEVFSMTGTRIAVIQQPNKIAKGNHTIEWNAANIPSGVYIIVLTTDKGKKIQKVVKL